ncbi:MAG: NADPH-dependent FMN reductase [Thermoanaerobaculia bacterium]
MARLIGISGSTRKASFNSALLRAAAALVPTGSTLEIASIAGIPLYDGDVESAPGVPQIVTELKDRIAASDGLVLVTPEYNNSLPGVFKNAIDWLSRPGSDVPRVFGGKPVALFGATPGIGGTRLAQAAWGPVLRALGTQPWNGASLYVGGAEKVFDASGTLVDEKVKQLLTKLMAGFVSFIDEK